MDVWADFLLFCACTCITFIASHLSMHFTFVLWQNSRVSHFFAPLPRDACNDSKWRRWEYCWGTKTLNQLNMYLIQYVWQNYETLLSCMIRAFILFWVGSSEMPNFFFTLFSSPASSLRSLRPELCPAATLRGGSGGRMQVIEMKWIYSKSASRLLSLW